jgi:hypothetical protein
MENTEPLTRTRSSEYICLANKNLDEFIKEINEDAEHLIKTWGVKREDISFESSQGDYEAYVCLSVDTPETPQEVEQRLKEDRELVAIYVKNAIETLKNSGYNIDSITLA